MWLLLDPRHDGSEGAAPVIPPGLPSFCLHYLKVLLGHVFGLA